MNCWQLLEKMGEPERKGNEKDGLSKMVVFRDRKKKGISYKFPVVSFGK